jgi:hypothetical protein
MHRFYKFNPKFGRKTIKIHYKTGEAFIRKICGRHFEFNDMHVKFYNPRLQNKKFLTDHVEANDYLEIEEVEHYAYGERNEDSDNDIMEISDGDNENVIVNENNQIYANDEENANDGENANDEENANDGENANDEENVSDEDSDTDLLELGNMEDDLNDQDDESVS